MATSNTSKPTQSTTNESKQQGSSQHSTAQHSTVARSDRERSIETGREAERRDRGNNLTPRRGPSAALAGSPFSLMQRMAEDMDRLFEQFGFGRMGVGLTPRLGSLLDGEPFADRGTQDLSTTWSPQIETFRRGDNLVIRADIPGVKKDDVHVEVENDVLTISGERNEEHEENRDGYYRSERNYGQFYRAIPLPDGVSADQCNASFKDGVLEVTLPAPKQEERKARRIQIK